MELSILVYVLLLIAFAKALGEAVSRFNQPSIVGELLAGVVLGPYILGAVFDLEDMYNDDFLANLADLGILFLMLYVGLEFSPRGIFKASLHGGVIAVFAIAVPLVMGIYVGYIFGLEGSTLYFVGIAMAVTALPVTIRILKDLEVLETKTSEVIVSAALLTDLVLLLAMGLVLTEGGETRSAFDTFVLGAGFVLFFILAILLGRYVVPYVYKLLKWMQTGEAAFAVAIGIAIAFAVLAEHMGIPAFIGAFIAGLLLKETGTGLRVWSRVEDILSGVTLGLLAPVFFVTIGFTVEFDEVIDVLPFFVSVLVTAIVMKLIWAYVPARLMGHGQNESIAIGSMMMGKGAMELVFAQLALEQNLIGYDVFSVLVLMAFTSTVLAPIMFRHYFNKAVKANEVARGPRPEHVPEVSSVR